MIRPVVRDSLSAWVDESVFSHPEQGFYLLAATIADPAACVPLRAELRSLLARRSPRLHWRDEPPARQLFIAARMASYGLAHTVVVGAPLDRRKSERARRFCLEALLLNLQAAGVRQVWIESRGPIENDRDRSMVNAMRAKHLLTAPLVVDFAQPIQEPMLWIPDAVAGAVAGARRGSGSEPRELFGDAVTEIAVAVR